MWGLMDKVAYNKAGNEVTLVKRRTQLRDAERQEASPAVLASTVAGGDVATRVAEPPRKEKLGELVPLSGGRSIVLTQSRLSVGRDPVVRHRAAVHRCVPSALSALYVQRLVVREGSEECQRRTDQSHARRSETHRAGRDPEHCHAPVRGPLQSLGLGRRRHHAAGRSVLAAGGADFSERRTFAVDRPTAGLGQECPQLAAAVRPPPRPVVRSAPRLRTHRADAPWSSSSRARLVTRALPKMRLEPLIVWALRCMVVKSPAAIDCFRSCSNCGNSPRKTSITSRSSSWSPSTDSRATTKSKAAEAGRVVRGAFCRGHLLDCLVKLFFADRFRQVTIHARCQTTLLVTLLDVCRDRQDRQPPALPVAPPRGSAAPPPNRPSPASARPSG